MGNGTQIWHKIKKKHILNAANKYYFTNVVHPLELTFSALGHLFLHWTMSEHVYFSQCSELDNNEEGFRRFDIYYLYNPENIYLYINYFKVCVFFVKTGGDFNKKKNN